MHFLSGILKQHAQKVWCIDKVVVEIKKKQVRDVQFPESEDYLDEDTYAELRHEELNAGNNGIDLRLLQNALMKLEEEMRVDTEVNGPSVFTSDDLKLIRQVIITQTKIPSWLNRPSLIFGDASASKVRSANWITFFTVFMPFAIAELKKTPQDEFVESWYHLAMVAELAMEYKVDKSSIQHYIFHLTAYRSNLQEYHPDHFATPMRFWTSQLPSLLAFHANQRHPSKSCLTNNKINEMDLTMLKHAGRASNLGILLELLDLPTVVAKMASRSNQQKKLRLLLLDMSEVQHNSKEILDAKKLSKFQTNFLLPASTQPINQSLKSQVQTIRITAGLIYMNSSDKGSSSISYCLGSTPQAFGTIVHMLQTVLFEACGKGKRSHKLHTLMCVQRRERLSPFNEMKTPYSKACPGIKSKLFYAPPEMDHAD
ncbi:hypothetical protein KEM48_006792 [Puccinia striiformis f. sp. tritici PST-130]|nr:hypothetical protein KEM48_006792 [Puccinia striiformis f. sp. tritici PST-130]